MKHDLSAGLTPPVQGMLRDTAASVASGATLMIILTLLAVVPVHPVLEAHYVIPLLGMLLGNSIGGLSVGLAAILEELHSGGGEGKQECRVSEALFRDAHIS